jgi:hypothetical protein
LIAGGTALPTDGQRLTCRHTPEIFTRKTGCLNRQQPTEGIHLGDFKLNYSRRARGRLAAWAWGGFLTREEKLPGGTKLQGNPAGTAEEMKIIAGGQYLNVY